MEFNLADLFEIVADTVPDREAVVCGPVRRTYRELDDRSTRLAHHLRNRDVRPGDAVGILAWNRPEWIEAMLGAWKARAVAVNCNYRYTARELAHVLLDAGCAALVHEASLTPTVAALAPHVPALRHRVVIDDGNDVIDDGNDVIDGGVPYEDALGAAETDRATLGPRSGDDRYVLYTGGTTGAPKGVVWRAEDVFFAAMGGAGWGREPLAHPAALRDRLRTDDAAAIRVLLLGPLMHGGAQWGACMTLFDGNTVVLDPAHHFDAGAVWDIVERERVQAIVVVGDAHGRPLADAVTADPDRWDLGCVAVLSSGGAILSPTVKEELRAALPHALVLDGFGASEMGATGAVVDFDQPAAGPRFRMHESAAVLDDDLVPLAPGDGRIGRLARRGHIPLGYHRDDERTAHTFVIDAHGTRWVLPGDLATVEADGAITVLGRGATSINTGGEKVHPEEVEAAVKSHPDVFDAVVVGVPDPRYGEAVAVVVAPRPGARPDLEEIRAHCAHRLARYKLPRWLLLADEVPRTPVGKPDYPAARALLAADPFV